MQYNIIKSDIVRHVVDKLLIFIRISNVYQRGVTFNFVMHIFHTSMISVKLCQDM